METLTDYVDTTGSVFLGLTVGCARCHDHKFDPIPQRDYYRLQAIFAPAVKTKVALNRLGSLGWDVAENSREIKLRDIGEEIQDIQRRCREKLRGAPDERRVADEAIRGCLNAEEHERLRAVERRLVAMYSNHGPKPFSCGITDVGDHAPKTLLPVRGAKSEEDVEPGFLTVLGGGHVPQKSFARETTGPIPLFPTTGRRHALANWIARPENPLTARVMVNRIWQHHFGRGIVATPSDFGVRGRAPSHPELLDWLAEEFVAQGWSIKKMHRLMVTSAAYRQKSTGDAESVAKDPENLYLSRFSRRRLDADEIRDSVLATAGALNLKAGGRPVVPPLNKEELFNLIGRVEEMWLVTKNESEHLRRGVYLFQKRTFRLPMMEVFDAPESMLTCSRRENSTTAPQSLTLLNGPFVITQAGRVAAKLAADYPDDAALARTAFRQVLLRDPRPAEENAASELLRAQAANAGGRSAAVTELVRALYNLNEFLYVD